LRSNNASPEIHQPIVFDTKTYNIKQDDIINVFRDFGDNTKKSNTALTMEYTYSQPGKRVVTQTITLIDGKILTNILTINITDTSLLASYALLMTPSKLIAKIGEKIDFSTHIVGNLMKTPIIQIFEFADGTTQKKDGTDKMPNLFTHSYQKESITTPQDSMFINQCTYLKNQATISVQGIDMCLDAKIQ